MSKTGKVPMREVDDHKTILRSALFDSDGNDRDVTKDIAPAFMKFDRNGEAYCIYMVSPSVSAELY